MCKRKRSGRKLKFKVRALVWVGFFMNTQSSISDIGVHEFENLKEVYHVVERLNCGYIRWLNEDKESSSVYLEQSTVSGRKFYYEEILPEMIECFLVNEELSTEKALESLLAGVKDYECWIDMIMKAETSETTNYKIVIGLKNEGYFWGTDNTLAEARKQTAAVLLKYCKLCKPPQTVASKRASASLKELKTITFNDNKEFLEYLCKKNCIPFILNTTKDENNVCSVKLSIGCDYKRMIRKRNENTAIKMLCKQALGETEAWLPSIRWYCIFKKQSSTDRSAIPEMEFSGPEMICNLQTQPARDVLQTLASKYGFKVTYMEQEGNSKVFLTRCTLEYENFVVMTETLGKSKKASKMQCSQFMLELLWRSNLFPKIKEDIKEIYL
ncbi:Sugar fermentation stimulation protein [Trichinella spiralis]|uniref:Sugar fermentation stimulation protein n=1 Tax=Trichinella spiralis TaxID=6334 RepID=A0ABR3KS77_TRISP